MGLNNAKNLARLGKGKGDRFAHRPPKRGIIAEEPPPDYTWVSSDTLDSYAMPTPKYEKDDVAKYMKKFLSDSSAVGDPELIDIEQSYHKMWDMRCGAGEGWMQDTGSPNWSTTYLEAFNQRLEYLVNTLPVDFDFFAELSTI